MSLCSLRRLLLAVASFGLAVGAGAVELPPTFGTKTPEGRPVPDLKLVYSQNFEGSLTGFTLTGGSWVTSGTGLLAGKRSLRLTASSSLTLPASTLRLKPRRTYLVEFQYQLVTPQPGNKVLLVGFQWPGLDLGARGNLSGPYNGATSSTGWHQHAMRVADTDQAEIVIFCTAGEAVIDSIQVHELATKVHVAEPPLKRPAFPRLSSFHVVSSASDSETWQIPREQIRQNLGLYDLVNGIFLDHTLGDENDHFWLKRINPDITLLPYFNAFVAHLDDSQVVGGSAGLHGFFNRGLSDAWFMRDSGGRKLAELLYPLNYQMNHTRFSRKSEGVGYVDYVDHFLGRSVLPSGLWEGIHFDESEWSVNSLLSNPDPYFSSDGDFRLPDLDLAGDGQSDPAATLYPEWASAFNTYFDRLARSLGTDTVFFGNVGTVTRNTSVLRRLNGMQWECFNPYGVGASGSWDTTKASAWYDFFSRNQAAQQFLRAPQFVACQFTGLHLGVPTGQFTGNGIADRRPVLEARDYRQARFGLATTLLTNAFFGYDFVDNTSLPLAWFDEYAVGTDGRPTKTLAAKGYLGQPLGPAVELPSAMTEVLAIDFEPGRAIPASVWLDPRVSSVTDAAKKISGVASGAIALDTASETAIFATSPASTPMQQGVVYNLSVDYRIVGHQSERFQMFLAAGIMDLNGALTPDHRQFSMVTYQDADVGQRGTLRAVCKPANGQHSAAIFVTDRGSLVIDNIRLTKGPGGVFRRDFEKGIVLVNPTPDALTVTPAQIQGPLNRANIRRIAGRQAPTWNNGAAVASQLTIGSGDAIILLANGITAPPPGTPQGLNAQAATDSVRVQWQKAPGTVEGYVVNYGLAGGDLTRFAMVGDTTESVVGGLDPGSSYDFEVRAVDYRSNRGTPTGRLRVTTPGASRVRPQMNAGVRLKPGAVASVAGVRLAGQSATAPGGVATTPLGNTQLLVNGVPAPLLSVSPGEIRCVVPAQIGGVRAVVRVESGGVSSPSIYAPLDP